jgi:hypothetical protein
LWNVSSFFFFPQPEGYLTVSDLALALPDDFVTEPNWVPGGPTDLVTFITVNLGSVDCSTRFEDLRLQGTEFSVPEPDPFLVHQPLWGIGVTGLDVAFPVFSSGGNHVVKDSEISKVGIQATIHQILKDASIEITDNTLTDVKQVITRWLDGADVSITGNTMNTFTFGSIVVTQEGVPVPGDAGLWNVSSFFFFPQPEGYLTVSDLALALPDDFVTETWLASRSYLAKTARWSATTISEGMRSLGFLPMA